MGMKSWEGEMLQRLCVRKGSKTCREAIGMGGKNRRKQETNTSTCSRVIAVRLSWTKDRGSVMQMLSSSVWMIEKKLKTWLICPTNDLGRTGGDARFICLAGDLEGMETRRVRGREGGAVPREHTAGGGLAS